MKVYIIREEKEFLRGVSLDCEQANAAMKLFKEEKPGVLFDVAVRDTEDLDQLLSGKRYYTVRFSACGTPCSVGPGEAIPSFSQAICHNADTGEVMVEVFANNPEQAIEIARERRLQMLAFVAEATAIAKESLSRK